MKSLFVFLFFLGMLVAVLAVGDEPIDLIKEKIKERYNRRLNRYGENDEAALKRIKDHDEHRMNKMREILAERQAQLEAHEKGHRRLSDEDHTRFTRQVNAFQKKLDQMARMSDEEYDGMMGELARSLSEMNKIPLPDL